MPNKNNAKNAKNASKTLKRSIGSRNLLRPNMSTKQAAMNELKAMTNLANTQWQTRRRKRSTRTRKH
jgi:hypothetical protein